MTVKTFTGAQILEWLKSQEWSKKQWLATPNGKPHPRPAHEIQQKRDDLEIIQYMISRYPAKTEGGE